MTVTSTVTSDESSSVPASPSFRGDQFAGTWAMVRFMLRRDRIRLPAWAAGFGAFVAYLAALLPTVYESEDDLGAATTLFADPVGRMLTGPGYGFDAPTYERFVANGYGLYFLLLGGLMNILLVVRHTRVEEQSGRAELVRANVVGRHAALTAALFVGVITNVVVAGTVATLLVAIGGFAPIGSLLFGASIATVGLAFAGLTTITVQLSEYSRAAAGVAGAVLGASFVLRAGGDMAAEGGNVLSWMSPLGWGQQTAPFVLDRWWPLVMPLIAAASTATVGYVLSARRDLGSSLTAVRPGRPRATTALGNPWGLALRLQRAGIIGWTSALAVSGLAFGAFADALLGAIDDMPAAFVDLFGADDLLNGYLGYMAWFMSLLTATYAVLAVQGLRNEETSGRAEPVLATPVSRTVWLGSHLVVIAAGVAMMTAATGFATGIGAAIVTGDTTHVGELTLAHLNHVPAALTVLGLAALLYGILPRAVPATWAVIGYALVVGTFGPVLDLPTALDGLSPFAHLPQLPLETFDPVPALALGAMAVTGCTIALVGFRRRDIAGS